MSLFVCVCVCVCVCVYVCVSVCVCVFYVCTYRPINEHLEHILHTPSIESDEGCKPMLIIISNIRNPMLC